MHRPPSLPELQSGMARSIIDGAVPDWLPWIATRGIEPVARLQIYRNAVLATQVDTLETSFPAVRRMLGEDCFDGWATRYAAWNGSHSGNLQNLGHDFAGFLQGQSDLAGLRWLGDLARLEWLRQRTILAAEAPALAMTTLHASLLAADGDPGLRLLPCVHALGSALPVLDVWHFSQSPDDMALDLHAGPQGALLWREHGQVAMQACSPATATFIAALIDGITVANAMAAAQQVDASVTLAPLLAPLLDNALVQDVLYPPICTSRDRS